MAMNNEETNRKLRTAKLDFNAILFSFFILSSLSSLLGLAGAVLFTLKFTPVFTSGANYHKPLRAALFQSLHKTEGWTRLVNAVRTAVAAAYADLSPKFADKENFDPKVIKDIPNHVVNNVAADWFLCENLSTEEKQRLNAIASEVTGLVNQCSNVGLIRAMYGMFCGKTAFVWEIISYVLGRGNVCASLRRMQGISDNMQTIWGRLRFVWLILTKNDSTSEDPPLFKGMVALRDMNRLCLKWTKTAQDGSFLKAFCTELCKKFDGYPKEEKDQMVASSSVFLLGALLRVTVDEVLILFESLYKDNSREVTQLRSEFYDMLHTTELDSEDPTPNQALAAATKLGHFLANKTAVQNVDRGDARVRLASGENDAPEPTPFSIASDKSDCAGKRLGMIILCEIMIKFKTEFQEVSEMGGIILDSSSELTDAFYRIDSLSFRYRIDSLSFRPTFA